MVPIPSGPTPEDFIKGDEHSYLRNPKIAEMFYYTKNIDKWASGLQRISNECKTNNVAFEFKVLSNGFLTKFLRQTQEKTTLKTTLKTDNKTTPKTAEKIIKLIQKNPLISKTELANALGNITEEGVKYNLDKLKKSSRIKHIGPKNGGYWEIL